MADLTEQEERWVRSYVEGQLHDPDDPVNLVQRVGRRRVAGTSHDLYDVVTTKGRWWVITEMTNLYAQEDFPSIEMAFTYHLGLCLVLGERSRSEISDAAVEYVSGPWRRFARAADAMSEATEAEDFQAVGVRCREALLALVVQHASSAWVPELVDPPQRANFKAWSEVFADALTTGRPRRYLKGLCEKTWDLSVWLQHYADATEWDAEMMLDATAHLLNHFTLTVIKHERGQPRRCPSCESYRVTQDGEHDVVDGADGWRSWDACAACGWTTDSVFTPWNGGSPDSAELAD